MNRHQKRAAAKVEEKKPNKVAKTDLDKDEKEIEKEIASANKELANIENSIGALDKKRMILKLQIQNKKVALATLQIVKNKYFKADETTPTDKA